VTRRLPLASLVLVALGLACAAPAADAAFPGGNGRIAFSRAAQGVWDVSPDGSGARRLSPPEGGCDSAPSYSPSGAQIAFDSCDPAGHTTGVFTMNADGTGRAQSVAQSGGRPYPQAPAFAATGTQIAFQAGLDTTRIFISNLDGTGVHRITSVGYGPRFSVGGALAFTVPQHPQQWCNSTELDDVYTQAPGSSRARRITHSYGSYDPDWSPDGTRLLFTRDPRVSKKDFRLVKHLHDCRPLLRRASAYGQDVMTMNANGRGVHRVIAGGSSPVWSPDGTQVAYEHSGWIWVAGADGSNPHRVVQGNQPSWQPLR
jgi:Tol biopolymer transport system component